MGNGEIFIVRAGRREGPFSSQALQAAVRVGSVDRRTAAMVGVDRTLRTVGSIIDELPLAAPPLAMPPGAVRSPPPTYPRGEASPEATPRPSRPGPRPGLVIVRVLAVVVFAVLILAVVLKSGRARVGAGGDSSESVGGPGTGGAAREAPAREAPATGRIARNPEEQRKSVLLVRTSGSNSSGFIAKVEGRYFAYTSVHCIDSEDIGFFDYLGRRVAVREPVEVVAASIGLDVDIARMRLVDTPEYALEFAEEGRFAARDAVFALGDSGGEGVLLSLPGTIVGVGPFKVEVDCEFVPGNSGGPIVTGDGRVVAIASYMTTDGTVWARGTQHAVRRFGWIPGRDYDWEAMSVADLVREQDLVRHGNVTTWFLSILAGFRMNENGFEGMADALEETELPGEVDEIADHPLLAGFLRTNETLAALPAGSSRDALAIREYLRFLRSCRVFAEGEMEQLGGLRSAFWRGSLREDPVAKGRVVGRFTSLVEAYGKAPRFGVRLID